jgi:hypothetical protein
MRDVKRAKSVGERSALPVVAALLTCGIFVLYGLTPPRREALIIRNAMGAPFHAIYTGVFLYYYMPVDRLFSLVYIVPGLAGFGTLLGFFVAGRMETAILGYLCAVAGCITPLLPFIRVVLHGTLRSFCFVCFPVQIHSRINIAGMCSWLDAAHRVGEEVHGGHAAGANGRTLCNQRGDLDIQYHGGEAAGLGDSGKPIRSYTLLLLDLYPPLCS